MQLLRVFRAGYIFWESSINSFDVREKYLHMFYTATVNSGLTFGLTCWGGNASIQNKNGHDRSIKKADGGGGGGG